VKLKTIPEIVEDSSKAIFEIGNLVKNFPKDVPIYQPSQVAGESDLSPLCTPYL
jgi:hypothetical protein